MSDFRWIAMALTVTAGCQVYDRVPWRRLWTWLWAKALALRSWVFRDELGDVLAREAGRELDAYAAPVRDADDWHYENLPAPPPLGPQTTAINFGPEHIPIAPTPRRRPTRSEAAKARKKAKR